MNTSRVSDAAALGLLVFPFLVAQGLIAVHAGQPKLRDISSLACFFGSGTGSVGHLPTLEGVVLHVHMLTGFESSVMTMSMLSSIGVRGKRWPRFLRFRMLTASASGRTCRQGHNSQF